MKQLTLIFAIFFLSLSRAAALENRVHPIVVLGSGVMFERGNDNVSESSRLPVSFGAGARFDSSAPLAEWSARIEYGSFHTTDGNSTISTSRDLETLLTWADYEFGREASWTPYLGIGLGMARTSTETRLAQSYESAIGSWSGMFSLAVGLRAAWLPQLLIRPELRYESAESLKTKDARMGVVMQLDFVF